MKNAKHKHIQDQKNWVEIYHRDKYKTAIPDQNPILYHVVTRVNYITSCLWLKWRNELVNDGRKGFVVLPDKPNWLVMTRNFKRRQDRMIKLLDYIKERNKRKLTTNTPTP